MINLSEQLKNAKLRKAPVPTKDYSDARLAGFLTQTEVDTYKSHVIDCNFENWYSLLQECTFYTKLCAIDFDESRLFVIVYERLFRDKDPSELTRIDWRNLLSQTEQVTLTGLETKLESAINSFKNEKPGEFVFVKTSSRSAKDSPLATERFKQLYSNYLAELEPVEKQSAENEQITCLLRAAFECLKMRNAREVIDSFIISERIYQDMMLATEKQSTKNFKESFVIRQFIQIDVDMEFRGFVFNGKLTALSQYNYLIHSERLNNEKINVQQKILKYFYETVVVKLADRFHSNYIIDFAVFLG
jgi:hypothetical protein